MTTTTTSKTATAITTATGGSGTTKLFISGNIACAEAAIIAGCRFFAGYPITPSSEIMEHMAARLPSVNGIFIQMEDELASMAAILGASCAGVKSMTATSGPGFSLMMENIGLGAMLEIPCVVVNVMRGGPSTGLPTLVGQADVMQARWGSHGDYEIIAVAPQSPQEFFDCTIKAFNLAEQYRVPTIVLADEVVGHMVESVVIPEKSEIKLYERRKPDTMKGECNKYGASELLIPPMSCAGDGYKVHFTGLTHDERGYPVIDAETQDRLVRRLVDKIRKNASKIIEYESVELEDAEIVIVAYGITARVARKTVELARNLGIKAGLLRLITIWPFPEQKIDELAEHIDGFVVAEINYGQIYYEVERCTHGKCRVELVPKLGGDIHHPKEILAKIQKMMGVVG